VSTFVSPLPSSRRATVIVVSRVERVIVAERGPEATTVPN
jgi:hypothetical protein